MLLQKLKSTVKANPTLHQWSLAVRRRIFPTETERFAEYLLRLTKLVSHPVFVKVGANDGITGDPCGDIFLKNVKWSGLLIEPVPYLFEKLQLIYDDHDRFAFEQVAIGSVSGIKTFFYVSKNAKEALPNLPSWYDQIGSFDRSHIIKHLNGILEPFIVETKVNVRHLNEVLVKNNVSRIDILHVDTEGYDLEILKTFEFSALTPLAIFIEHEHLSNHDKIKMLTILKSNGYVVRDCGTDFFAMNPGRCVV